MQLALRILGGHGDEDLEEGEGGECPFPVSAPAAAPGSAESSRGSTPSLSLSPTAEQGHQPSTSAAAAIGVVGGAGKATLYLSVDWRRTRLDWRGLMSRACRQGKWAPLAR